MPLLDELRFDEHIPTADVYVPDETRSGGYRSRRPAAKLRW